MNPGQESLLAVNCGSSSIRFAVHGSASPHRLLLKGKVDRIGSLDANLSVSYGPGTAARPTRMAAADPTGAGAALLEWLEAQPWFGVVRAVGHRVVHGMRHSEPEFVTPSLLRELRRITPYDPEHLPREISLIQEVHRRHPGMPQIACFDTAFHRTMAPVARRLPIPRRFGAKGVERYGFHGLSYSYLMEELARIDPTAARGRVILAHLGSGASMAAVAGGRSVDTSMGFTPAAGLVMGTRTGDLDPGLFYYLSRSEGMTAAGYQRMVFHEGGLRGVSGTSSDLRDLCAREASDSRAKEAVDLFCYQACKWIGSLAAALGGVDTLVFSAGIGENSPPIRRRICENLGFLGIKIDRRRNARNAGVISAVKGQVRVRVIHTDEELMIARSVARLLRAGRTARIQP